MKEQEPQSDILKYLSEEAKKYKLLKREEEVVLINQYQKPLKQLVELLRLKFTIEDGETQKQYDHRIYAMSKNLTLTPGSKYFSPECYKAQDRLLKHNLRLILKYARAAKVKTLEVYDLFCEGVLGFMHGLDKFDTSRRTKEGLPLKLSTYLTFWVKQQIQRGIQDKDRTIRIPIHIHDQINKVKKCYGEFCSQNYDRENPSPKEVGDIIGLDAETVARLGRHIHPLESLDKTTNDEENLTAHDYLEADEEKYNPEEIAEKSLNRQKLLHLIGQLPPEDKQFMLLRSGLGDGIDRNDREMANILGLRPKDIQRRELELTARLREIAQELGICS